MEYVRVNLEDPETVSGELTADTVAGGTQPGKGTQPGNCSDQEMVAISLECGDVINNILQEAERCNRGKPKEKREREVMMK